MKDWCEYK